MSRRLWLSAGVMLLLIIASATCWFLLIRDTGPIPRQFMKGLNFSLYYPTRLPAGYSVDPASFKREGDVLIFSIAAPENRNIAVSQQATPTDAPIHETKNAPINEPGEKNFLTGIGAAHISLWSDKYVSDIVTNDTWIILNVTGFTADEAKIVTQSFRGL